MNYKLFNVVSFAVGAAIGSAVTWKLVKSKYEQIAQEEIDDVRAYYKKKLEAFEEDVTEEEVQQSDDTTQTGYSQMTKDKPDIMEYAAKIKELKYAGESEQVEEEEEEYVEKEEDSMKDEPYVISADEFDEEGYDTETLTYFADGVLTDWYNEPVDNPEELVGSDTLANFDELADGDTVFVRNDNHATDYEIQRDHRNYKDVFPESEED